MRRIVVLNDIAGNTGPTKQQDYLNNIRAMIGIAKANHIKVLIASIPPAAAFPWLPQLRPADQMRELNARLRDLASRTHCVYIDYYEALVGTSGEFKPDLAYDGVHPNKAGYVVMRKIVERELR